MGFPSIPKPIDWAPSEYWDGDDGAWSTFPLLVGSPSTLIRVIPSTAGSTTLAVGPSGCAPSNFTASNCDTVRAGIYDYSNSTSASFALYLLDTVALGFSDTTRQASLDTQVVASYGSNSFYIGIFGLSRQPSNFSTLEDLHPSYLTSLRNQNLIPSLSWSYTAGARYRSESAFGSLTLGRYDASKFVASNISFPLAGDVSRDTVVPIQSISSKNSTGYSASLLPTPISAYIDSTVPYLYLPDEACRLFEQTLGLLYDSVSQKYLVDNGLHQSLLANNTNVTFHLGNNGDATVDIEMPYASFDLQGSFPFFPNGTNTTRYFPLRKATNDTQYTLGRAFLQEAYLITNYEYSNFSVSKRIFSDDTPNYLVSILSANETAALAAATPHTVNWRLAVGLGVSFGVIFTLLVALLYLILNRRRRQPICAVDRKSGLLISPPISNVELPADLALAEAVPDRTFGYHEVSDTEKAELASAKYATLGFLEMGDTGRHEMPVNNSRDPSVIEIISTIEVERSDGISRPPPTASPSQSEPSSGASFVVSPVTSVKGQRRDHTSSAPRPPRTGTSSDNHAPPHTSPISSQTSRNPSLNKSLPPTPTSGSVWNSYDVAMGEILPGLHSAAQLKVPMQFPENDEGVVEAYTPFKDITQGQRLATRLARPPSRQSALTPVSPQSPRSMGSSRDSSYITRSPASNISAKTQAESAFPSPRHRGEEEHNTSEDEEKPGRFEWNVLRKKGESRWPPETI